MYIIMIQTQEKLFNGIFKHGSFRKEVYDLLKSDLNKENFIEQLRKSLMYYFWSKSEYQVLILPWVGQADDIKIDIYDQVMMNWDKFSEYVWLNKEKI